jgi:hypothetical protein
MLRDESGGKSPAGRVLELVHERFERKRPVFRADPKPYRPQSQRR